MENIFLLGLFVFLFGRRIRHGDDAHIKRINNII